MCPVENSLLQVEVIESSIQFLGALIIIILFYF